MAQGGDAEALDALLRRWQERLWLLARRLTNDPESANDVLQEALLAIACGIRKLNDPIQFRSWAFRIVSNKSRDWIRSQKRRRKLAKTATEQEVTSPETECSTGNAQRKVRRALEKLPSDQQSILTLFYLEEMPIKEIAIALHLPNGTVKSRLFTARNHLKEILSKKEL